MLNCKAVIRIGTKWFTCDIIEDKIKNKKSIKSYTEYKNSISDKLITFKKYVKDNKIDEGDFVTKNEIASIYIRIEEKKKVPKDTKATPAPKKKKDNKPIPNTVKIREYVFDENFNEDEYEKNFHRNKNRNCVKCKNDCKQSSNVIIDRCPQYNI